MKIKLYGKRVNNLLKWQELIGVKDWFEKNINLTKGKTRGLFKTSEVPHLYKIFEIADRKEVKLIVLRVASQTQKTTFSLGMLMYWIDTDYHDMFYMIPRANDIKKFLNFKIKPFIDGCKSVKNKLEEYVLSEKERKNSFFYKTATNLFAVISANDTKSITTKYGVFDEAAEMDISIIEEALERFKDYGGEYKVIIVSTQIDEDDAINHYFNTAEIKYMYHLKCVHCEEYFIPGPEHLKIMTIDEYKKEIGKDDLTDDELLSDYLPYASRRAYLECPHCSSKITNKDKNKVIANNKCEWFPVSREKLENGDFIYKRVDEKQYFESVGFDLNSMLSKRVSIKDFAERELKCRLQKNPAEREEMYKKFYVGWWNRVYKTKNSEILNKNEVLEICNEYAFGVVPKDTAALHLGVDLQKDRLYYRIDAVEYQKDDFESGIISHIIEYGELYAGFDNQDFKELENIINRIYKDKEGKEFKITSVGCDIRGFSKDDESSRTNAMLDFIFNFAYHLKSYGVLDYDNFIHPMYGVDNFSNSMHEAQGYRIQDFKRAVNGEELKIKGIVFSNEKIKRIQNNMIKNAIAVKKGKKIKSNLLFATNEMCIRFNERMQLPPKDRLDKHSLEAHLSSEIYTYLRDKNGKLTNKKGWVKRNPSVRNDYWDCGNMIIAQIYAHDTYRIKKLEEEKPVNIGKQLEDLMK